jgi:hypothetical protein
VLAPFRIDLGDDDMRALRRQSSRIAFADAAAGARDNANLVFEPHRNPLNVMRLTHAA